MDCDVINEQPEQCLRSVNTVFAGFGVGKNWRQQRVEFSGDLGLQNGTTLLNLRLRDQIPVKAGYHNLPVTPHKENTKFRAQ